MVAGTWFQWRDLQIRIASAVVLIPLVIAAVRLGGWWYAGLIAVLAALMAKEWTRLVHAGSATQFLLHAAGGIAATILPALSVPALAAATILGLWISSLWLAHLSGAPFSLWSLAGIPYLALPAASLVLLRSDESWGFQAVMLVLLVVWVADTAAYFAGRVIGGPRLAPTLSPNKTWAGFSGAIVGGALAALAAGAWSNVARLWPLMLLGGLLAMIEQAGDLFEVGPQAVGRSKGLRTDDSRTWRRARPCRWAGCGRCGCCRDRPRPWRWQVCRGGTAFVVTLLARRMELGLTAIRSWRPNANKFATPIVDDVTGCCWMRSYRCCRHF